VKVFFAQMGILSEASFDPNLSSENFLAAFPIYFFAQINRKKLLFSNTPAVQGLSQALCFIEFTDILHLLANFQKTKLFFS
jgi:hypothetical protein